MCISKVLTSRISSPHHKAHHKACHFTVIEVLCKMLTASCCSHSDLHQRQIRDWQWMQNECWTQVYSGHKKDLNWGGAIFETGFNQSGCLRSHSSMSLQKCNLPRGHCTQYWMILQTNKSLLVLYLAPLKFDQPLYCFVDCVVKFFRFGLLSGCWITHTFGDPSVDKE